ncbi:hypothetical protein BHM03_00058632 [Ensete ventricosum]|uniref:Uncharacterized protein n=1 Tax=Ensete ventricosum TaxID=4639 RepID=A0A445MML4_ENSVE|nr:hypothetical protein BHM03_00058632 [Ensete ventricosum]
MAVGAKTAGGERGGTCYRRSKALADITAEMPNTRCKLSSTISPGRYHCRNVTLTGCEGVGWEQFIPRNQTSRSPVDAASESGLLQLMDTSNVEPRQEERGLP